VRANFPSLCNVVRNFFVLMLESKIACANTWALSKRPLRHEGKLACTDFCWQLSCACVTRKACMR